MKDEKLLYWKEHTSKASRRSAQWAATDRGWFFTRDVARTGGSPHAERSSGTIGHYLDYGPCGDHVAAKHGGRTVHAVACVTTRRSAWCATVADAKAWIEAELCLPPGLRYPAEGYTSHDACVAYLRAAGFEPVPGCARWRVLIADVLPSLGLEAEPGHGDRVAHIRDGSGPGDTFYVEIEK